MTTPIPLEALSPQTLRSIPVSIDWQEARGEDFDGWTFWEAFEREVTTDDGGVVTLWLVSPDGAEADVAFTEDGFRIDLNDPQEYWELTRPCRYCGTDVSSTDGDTWTPDAGDDPEVCTGEDSDGEHDVTGVLRSFDFDTLSREDDGSAQGPMMNYWYPLDENDCERIGAYEHTFDAVEAAFRLRHHSLCLVRVDNSLGLALTGGGMDFTWDIVEAFVDLGYLPPLHFCDLPGMAGHGPHQRQAEGWTVTSRDDDTARSGSRYTVTAPDGTSTEHEDWYDANRTVPKVEVPASEAHQRVIDAVTRSLTTAQERIGYQLQRHTEKYVRPVPVNSG